MAHRSAKDSIEDELKRYMLNWRVNDVMQWWSDHEANFLRIQARSRGGGGGGGGVRGSGGSDEPPLKGSRSAYVEVRCGSRQLPEATPGLRFLARVIIYISAEALKLNRKPTLDHSIIAPGQTSTCTNS